MNADEHRCSPTGGSACYDGVMAESHEVEDDDDVDDESDADEDPLDDDMDENDDPAIIPCPHCGGDVVEEAEQCPHCGKYVSEEDKPQGKSWMLVAGVFLLILLILSSWVIFAR